MLKEIVISLAIIILIIASENITRKYTDTVVNDLKAKLENLKQGLLNNNEDVIKNNIKNIDNEIEEVHGKLAYYIEHEELEKIEMSHIECKTFIEHGNYEFAISNIDKNIFSLEHIQDRYSFNLENIF